MATPAAIPTATPTPPPGLPAAPATLPAATHPALAALRARGAAVYARDGLPTPRVEAWKYTNLRALTGQDWSQPDGTAAVEAATLPTIGGEAAPWRLVFVDGRARAELSRTAGLPAGVTLASLRDRLDGDPDGTAALLARLPADPGVALDPALRTPRIGPFPARGRASGLTALADAHLAEGAVLAVPAGLALDRPVELVFVSTAASGAWHPRVLIDLGDGARATVVEHHVTQGGGAILANLVTSITVGAGAHLTHVKVQEEGLAATHLATVEVEVGTDGAYDTFVLQTGGALARHDLRVRLDGTGATTRIGGAYAVRGGQLSDITSLIDHAQPRCTSREVVKGVIDGNGRGVFQGKIVVRPQAQKTDGHQLNRALLLSDAAEINAKPELEIYADDVKCSHGATAGELDEDALFYLRARGLPLDAARALLITAFLDEVAEEITDEAVRAHVNSRIAHWQKG